MFAEAEEILAFTAFPKERWRQVAIREFMKPQLAPPERHWPGSGYAATRAFTVEDASQGWNQPR
jgi:hypothetical protein